LHNDAGYEHPHLVFCDLIHVHVSLAKEFKDKKGSCFYTAPDITHPLFRPVVESAQTYTDEVTLALIQAGYWVRHIVLSADAHACYNLANCKNAAHPYLASHPGGTRGKSELIRGNVGVLL
jgi:hypothetical protein